MEGYGGRTDYQGETFETINWASGLLAKTEKLTVFGTVHAPLLSPIAAAKQFVTADHIGDGRFGLNVVCGWNVDEFSMFGAEMRTHELRYEYAQEWLEVIKQAWSSERPFDCPSSGNLRLIRRFEKRGSGSSGLEFRRPAVGAASGGLR